MMKQLISGLAHLTRLQTVSSLNDVDDTARVDGSILTFDSSEDKYIATTTLEKQTIEGGSF